MYRSAYNIVSIIVALLVLWIIGYWFVVGVDKLAEEIARVIV